MVADSDSHVSSMTDGDFFSHEQSVTIAEAGQVHITFTDESGNATELRARLRSKPVKWWIPLSCARLL